MSVTAGARSNQPTDRAADDLEARLIATIPWVMRHLLAHAQRRSTWKQMTYQQYNVLRIIHSEGPVSQAEIARRLLVSAPVITRLAGGMVDGGLLERGSDPRDKRSVRLTLTPAGRRRATGMRRDLVAAARELVEPLPAERRAAVAAALDELQVLLPGRGSKR
jgi:DNA-binding MarR family transcriptional regulator